MVWRSLGILVYIFHILFTHFVVFIWPVDWTFVERSESQANLSLSCDFWGLVLRQILPESLQKTVEQLRIHCRIARPTLYENKSITLLHDELTSEGGNGIHHAVPKWETPGALVTSDLDSFQ